jgi:hypothetical protein
LLLTVANIRNLRQILKEKYKKMKLTFEYNPAKDPLYKEVKQVSYSEGREDGREEEREKFLFNMFELGTMDIRDIALIIGMPIEYVVKKKALWDEQRNK